jgi:putative ABC transport system permease protein
VLAQQGLAAVGDALGLDDGQRRVPAVVVGTAPGAVPSLLTARPWVVVDRGLLLAAGGDVPLPVTALLALDGGGAGGATHPGLEADLRTAMGTASPLLTRAGAVDRVREAPLVAGTLAAFPIASAVAAGLSALAVVLTLVVTAPARSRLLSRLRTLGLSPRQAQGLAVWEVAPLAVTALAAGLLLGLAVPWLVAPAVDLRPFTGGTSAPPYTVGAAAVAAIAAGFVLLIAVAVAVTVSANRRLRLGAVLRVGEEQ